MHITGRPIAMCSKHGEHNSWCNVHRALTGTDLQLLGPGGVGVRGARFREQLAEQTAAPRQRVGGDGVQLRLAHQREPDERQRLLYVCELPLQTCAGAADRSATRLCPADDQLPQQELS